MFREVFRKEIEDTLSSYAFFSQFEFTITEVNPAQTKIQIQYEPDKQYFFKFDIPTSQTEVEGKFGPSQYYIYKVEAAPWESARIEKISFSSKKEFLDGLEKWLGFLQEDLLSTISNRRIKEIEKQMSEFAGNLDGIEGQYFSADEADDLRRKLDELQEKISENIKEVYKKAEERDELVDQLKMEVDALKAKIEIFEKKGVFKSIFGMVLNWSSKPESRKLIGDGTKFVTSLLDQKPGDGN